MKRFTSLVWVALLSGIFETLFAQCSDAGVCAIGKMPSSLRRQAAIGYYFGRSGKAEDITYHSLQIEVNIQILENSNLFISLPWSRQSGPLGSTSGIGDLSILWSQSVWQGEEFHFSVEAGGKISTANANADNLPQAYQSGLGTNDAIVGLSLSHERWKGAAGYQLSRGRSNNSITRLRRGDDIFLRLGYSDDSNDIQISGELLAIKRLDESSVLDAAGAGFTNVAGSDQFQINALASAVIPLDDSKTLRVVGAVPFIQRKVNVDGLTRSFTLSLALLTTF